MDEVSIPVSLLEQIRDTLDSAYWFSSTFDLQEHYRKQSGGKVKESKLSNNLAGALGVATSFIEIAGTEVEDAQPKPE